MTCQRIQDRLLTDYLDGTLSSEDIRTVEDHTAVCPSCRALRQAAEIRLVKPFAQMPDPALDREAIWLKVADTIQAEEVLRTAPALWEWILSWKGFPRPALLAGGLALLLAAIMFPMLPSQRAAQPEDAGPSYLAYVLDEIGSFADENEGDYDTAIEHYFL